jgi:hypothetical protein
MTIVVSSPYQYQFQGKPVSLLTRITGRVRCGGGGGGTTRLFALFVDRDYLVGISFLLLSTCTTRSSDNALPWHSCIGSSPGEVRDVPRNAGPKADIGGLFDEVSPDTRLQLYHLILLLQRLLRLLRERNDLSVIIGEDLETAQTLFDLPCQDSSTINLYDCPFLRPPSYTITHVDSHRSTTYLWMYTNFTTNPLRSHKPPSSLVACSRSQDHL